MAGKDMDYVRRVLGEQRVIDRERDDRPMVLCDGDRAIGFLLGKGLTPQEVYDVLETWWTEGFCAGAYQARRDAAAEREERGGR